LGGATFELYHQPFTVTTGTYEVQDINNQTGEPDLTADTWTQVGSAVTTARDGDTKGTYTWPYLDPGVYYIVETDAPDGYDKADEGKFAVVTGNMGITVQSGQPISS